MFIHNQMIRILITLSAVLLCIRQICCDIAIISPLNRTVDVFMDIPLTFAEPIPYDGLFGRVVMSKPANACSPIEHPPQMNATHKWIALIERTHCQSLIKDCKCNNYLKVRNAMAAHYDAVIIYNSDTSSVKKASVHYPQIENALPYTDSGITIPAVLVSLDDGLTIQRDYLYDRGYYVMIIADLPFNINAYLLPFAIVIGVCLLLMVAFMIFQIVKCVRDRRRRQRHRLSSRHLKKIPTMKFKKGDNYDTCAICLEEYVENDKLRVLPCGHAYHIKCIDPWLTKNRRVCPVCKGKVVLPGMSDVSDTDSEHENTNHGAANERTPLLSNLNQNDRRRNNRRRRRSYPQSADSVSRSNDTHVNQVDVENAQIENTLIVDNCSVSAPNVTLVEAVITLPPNGHSVNCDRDYEEMPIESQNEIPDDTSHVPQNNDRRFARIRGYDVIV